MLGRAEALTRGRLLAGNVALNLAGWLLPALVALAAYPVLIRSMGTERFGLLALAWSVVGYFSVFDLGVGRALTQALAEQAARGDESESPALTWTSLWLIAPFGCACALALALAAPALTDRVFAVPPALRGEAVASLRLLALAVPPLVITAALRGVLEAGQRFRTVNALRVPLGLISFAGPMAVQPYTRSLPAAVGVLVAARAVLCVLHLWAVLRAYPPLRRVRAPRRADAARLWRVAGWLTVSSIISPVLVSVDRFAVGALLPVAALAHYATASEVATKMWLFTAALLPVLFPALASDLVTSPERAAALFDRAARAIVLALAPAALVLVLFGRDALTLWLGAAFARESAPALQWLAIAVLLNSVAQVPYAAVQGAGRADVAAKLHLVELPIYGALLWWLAREYGVVGVAFAWLARMAGDGFALLTSTRRVLPALDAAARRAGWAMLASAVGLALCTRPETLGARAATLGVGLVALAVAARFGLVTPSERAAVRGWVARRRAAGAVDTAHETTSADAPGVTSGA